MAFPNTVCKASEIGGKKMDPFSNKMLSNKWTTFHAERASDITFRSVSEKKRVRGSLTIEAALVLPVVVFVLLGVCYFFRILSLQTKVAETLNRVVEEITACADLGDRVPGLFSDEQDEAVLTSSEEEARQDILSNFNNSFGTIARHGLEIGLLNLLFDRYLPKGYLDDSPIVNGAKGLSFNGTLLTPGTEYLDARVSYTVHLWGLPPGMNEIELMQRCRRRYWRGYDTEKNEAQQTEEVVYVTEYGEVYHTFRDCYNLNRNIKTIARTHVADARNENGGKYYACEFCIRNETPEYVYITTDGDRYHSRTECLALIRYIHQIKRSETNGRPLCSVCAAREAEIKKQEISGGQ